MRSTAIFARFEPVGAIAGDAPEVQRLVAHPIAAPAVAAPARRVAPVPRLRRDTAPRAADRSSRWSSCVDRDRAATRRCARRPSVCAVARSSSGMRRRSSSESMSPGRRPAASNARAVVGACARRRGGPAGAAAPMRIAASSSRLARSLLLQQREQLERRAAAQALPCRVEHLAERQPRRRRTACSPSVSPAHARVRTATSAASRRACVLCTTRTVAVTRVYDCAPRGWRCTVRAKLEGALRTNIVFGLVVFCVACGPASKRGGDDDGNGVDGSTGSGVGSSCATSMVKAEKVPLDMYVMLDQSGSMSDTVAGGGTKWTAVTGALTSVRAAARPRRRVGRHAVLRRAAGRRERVHRCYRARTDADCGATACGPCIPGIVHLRGSSAAAAATRAPPPTTRRPAVEIAPLPGVGRPDHASIGGRTRRPPARRRRRRCKARSITRRRGRRAHAGDVVVAVLATDGDPSECDTDARPTSTRSRRPAATGDAEDPHVRDRRRLVAVEPQRHRRGRRHDRRRSSSTPAATSTSSSSTR